MYLAIDQALEKSGWAVGTPTAGCIECGLFNNRGSRFTDLGGRFLQYETWLNSVIATFEPTVISYEAHRSHSGVQAAQVLGAVTALIMKAAKTNNIPSFGIEVGTHKKIFTGHARATKELSLAVARKKYPRLDVVDHNVADAIGILHATFKHLNK